MEGRMLDKNVIFYSPGTKGAAFSCAANHFITPQVVRQTIAYLEYETEKPISYVEERRAEPRPPMEY